MTGTRLLERLNGTANNRSERRRRDEQQLKASVIGHVHKLLNTRRGNVPIDPEFGMPRISQSGGSDGGQGIEQVDRTIRDLLERYEPRLSEVEVTTRGFSGRELGIDVEIKGTIMHRDQGLSVRLRGTVLTDGRFIVAQGARS